jgi:hypothetical protein
MLHNCLDREVLNRTRQYVKPSLFLGYIAKQTTKPSKQKQYHRKVQYVVVVVVAVTTNQDKEAAFVIILFVEYFLHLI